MSFITDVKVLVDYEVYQQLISYRDEILKLHEEKKKELEIGPTNTSQRKELKAAEQTGFGSDLEEKVFRKVINHLSNRINISKLENIIKGTF